MPYFTHRNFKSEHWYEHKLNWLAFLNCKNASGDQRCLELILAWEKETRSCFLVRSGVFFLIRDDCNLLLSDHKSLLFPSPRQCGRSLFLCSFPWHKHFLPLHVCVCKRSNLLSENILRWGLWTGGWCQSTPRLHAGVRPRSRSVVVSAFFRSYLGRWAGVAVQKWEEGLWGAGLVSY